MGTHGIVAIDDGETEWKGVYVHYDGYPNGLGRSCWEIVNRMGREAAVDMLYREGGYWGFVDSRTSIRDACHNGERIVPGIGQWNPDPHQPIMRSIHDDLMATRWIYILRENDIAVLYRPNLRQRAGEHVVATVPYAEEIDWCALDRTPPSDDGF